MLTLMALVKLNRSQNKIKSHVEELDENGQRGELIGREGDERG